VSAPATASQYAPSGARAEPHPTRPAYTSHLASIPPISIPAPLHRTAAGTPQGFAPARAAARSLTWLLSALSRDSHPGSGAGRLRLCLRPYPHLHLQRRQRWQPCHITRRRRRSPTHRTHFRRCIRQRCVFRRPCLSQHTLQAHRVCPETLVSLVCAQWMLDGCFSRVHPIV
jgi:hypothetical protein